MKKLIFKWVFFILIGAIIGYGYYYFIGCRTGSCPITSNPYISTGYGALFGLILGWDARLFKRNKKEEQ